MEEGQKVTAALSLLLLLVFSSGELHSRLSQSKQPWPVKHGRYHTSAFFSLTGNVYPDGYYYATLMIGDPPRQYLLDIDTGSDLTWIQCDPPFKKSAKAHRLYRPNVGGIVHRGDELCASLSPPTDPNKCAPTDDKCYYEVKYADSGSSLGVLVRDSFSLRFTNGSVLSPKLAFGCSYDQEAPNSTTLPYTDGVLGLGSGELSVVSQLSRLGIIRNVVGHCLGDRGGYLFFGEDPVPPHGITWAPLRSSNALSRKKHYSLGGAELFLGTQTTGVKGLTAIFDSGSSYTYLSSRAYAALLLSVEKKLGGGKAALKRVEDEALPVCWRGSKLFNYVADVSSHFPPVALGFTRPMKAAPAVLQVPPDAYLVVTADGNACLGVLNGTEAGLSHLNIIGDNLMKGKVVIYDNERGRIGWAEANCHIQRKKT